MESLGSTLRRITSKITSTTDYPKDREAADDSPVCSRCEGRGWLSMATAGKEYSCHRVQCPVCHISGNINYFADLLVEEGNTQAIELARAFAGNPSGWLVLVGDAGTGKTRLLNAILSTWRGSNRHALLSAELLDYWRMAVDNDDLGPTFQSYCMAPAFVLDDLGAEKATDWGKERLTMFLDFRYGRGLPTAISTNYSKQEMTQKLGERIADRVFDTGTGLVRIVTLDVISFRDR